MDRPVSIFIALFLMLMFRQRTQIPCENNLISNSVRDFIHADSYHLLINLFGLYYISDLETKIGSQNYFILILDMILLSSIIKYFVKLYFNTKCSIGFSGVILGAITYNILLQKGSFGIKPILFLILVSIFPSRQNVSISGHLIGIASGVISFFGQKLINI